VKPRVWHTGAHEQVCITSPSAAAPPSLEVCALVGGMLYACTSACILPDSGACWMDAHTGVSLTLRTYMIQAFAVKTLCGELVGHAFRSHAPAPSLAISHVRDGKGSGVRMSRGMGSRAPPLPGPSPAARAALMAAGASPSGVREPPPLPGPSPAARAAALSVGARHDSGADSSARLVVTGEASGIKLGVITLDSPPPEPCSECGLQDRDLLLHNDPSKGALYYCRECWALVEDMTALKEIACACQPPAASYDWAHRCEDCGKCDAHGRVDDDDGNFYCSACWALSEECAADRARAADYVSVCNECGAVGLGDLDDSDDQFYCNDCWAAIGLRPGSSSASASTSNLPPPLPGPSPAARAAALLQTPSPSGNGTGGRESARATGRSGTAFKLEVSDLNDHYISQPHAHNAAPSAVPPPTVCAATASRQQDLGSKSDGKDKGWRIRLPVREVMREQKVRQVLHDEQMRDEVVEAQAERASTGQAYTCSEWSACGPSGLSEGAGIGYDVGRNGDKGVRGDGDEGRGKEDCAQQTRQQQQQVMTQKQMQQERMREWKEWEAMRRRREEEELRARRQKEEEERRRAAELWRLMAEDEREKQRLLEKDLQQQQQQQQQQIETAQRPRRLYESFVPGEQQGEDREEEEKGALGSASCQGGDIKESSENGSNGRRERRHKAASGRRFNVKVLVRALKASIGPWSAQSDVTDVTEGALTHSKQEVDHALIGSTHASANGSSQGCAAPPSCPDTLRRPKDVKTNAGHEALSKDMKTNAALEEHRYRFCVAVCVPPQVRERALPRGEREGAVWG
jgi:hypothetical protein